MNFRSLALFVMAAIVSSSAFPNNGGSNEEIGGGEDRNETARDIERTANPDDRDPIRTRPPRFGLPVYSHDVQGTGNVYPGLYGPLKLDIGGLLLGTIVGLGAFFILPKLFHVAANPYSGYKRSEDEAPNNGGTADLMGKFQQILNGINIDSSACLQRAICSSVRTSSEKVESQNANSLESVVDTIAKNDVFKALMEGTDWKKALEAAGKKENCGSVFRQCPEEVIAVISAISKYFVS